MSYTAAAALHSSSSHRTREADGRNGPGNPPLGADICWPLARGPPVQMWRRLLIVSKVPGTNRVARCPA